MQLDTRFVHTIKELTNTSIAIRPKWYKLDSLGHILVDCSSVDQIIYGLG
jgi:hypothetical protein